MKSELPPDCRKVGIRDGFRSGIQRAGSADLLDAEGDELMASQG